MFRRKYFIAAFARVCAFFFSCIPASALEWETDFDAGLLEAEERGAICGTGILPVINHGLEGRAT